jgi:RNA polymerase sigma-70 factor (ECF subfamily)
VTAAALEIASLFGPRDSFLGESAASISPLSTPLRALSVILGGRALPAPLRLVSTRPVQEARGPSIVRRVAFSRLDPAEERGLCDRAKAGDRVALGKLLRTYGPVLYRAVLLPRLASEAVAQDALAETYARVVERFDQYEWQDCGVYPWLRVVALRIALDILRSRKRETLFDPDDLAREIEKSSDAGSTSPDVDVLEARDLEVARAKVEAALKTLNPRYERAVRLRVLEERPREEVALALGVSVATFDVVLHRALTALKKAVHKVSGPPHDDDSRASVSPSATASGEETSP